MLQRLGRSLHKRYRRAEKLLFRLIGKFPLCCVLVVRLLRVILKPRRMLSGAALLSLTCLAETLADSGQLEQARWIYDQIFRFQPDQIEAYLRRYEALGGRLFLQGRRQDAMQYWRWQREKQHLLAEQHGLVPSQVGYMAPDWTWAFGHLGLMHLYLEQNLLRKQPKKLVLLAKRGLIANRALLNHYAPHLEIDDSPARAQTLPAILLGEGLAVLQTEAGETEYMMDACLRARKQWREQGRPPLLRLSDEERQRGKTLLAHLGVDPAGWFVCLHVRDGPTNADRWSRNAGLETYDEAVQVVTRAGGTVIRIGPKLDPPSAIPNLVDYASGPHRSEWGDVFLSAACRFFLGTNSGPCLIAEAFGVPCVVTNWHPFGEGPFGGIYTPKLLRHDKEKRYLSFAEMLQPPFGSTESHSILKKHQVTLVDNTAEDLVLVTEEMVQTLEKKFTRTQAQEEDQASFQRIMKRWQPSFDTEIGTAFLEKHRDLLAS